MKRSAIVKAAAVAVVAALLVTFAVVAEGFDVAQTPVNDSSIWALQAGDGNRYARVNTELHEIDTVKDVENPSALIQSDSATLVLMEGNGRIAGVDAGRPQNFDNDSSELSETPTGTTVVVSAGEYVAYLTDNGRVFAARIDQGADATPVAIDPYAEQNSEPGAQQQLYAADSVAVGADGTVYAYSIRESAVLRFTLDTGRVLGFDDVPGGPDDEGTALTVVGSSWALLAANGETLWLAGSEAINTGLVDDAQLQQSSSVGDRVYVASRNALTSFALGDGAPVTELERTGAIGIPAAPSELGGVVYAAWLSENDDAGLLWSSADGEQPLEYAGESLDAEPVPVLRKTRSRMILNDTESGWVWTIPDGVLVPSSQDWGLASADTEKSVDDEEQAAVVSERKPPVAEADQFGVRAGQLVTLPVLLNDHDPNEDVLTLEPSLIQGPDSSFGTISVTNNSQDLAIQVAPGASGTVTFQYAVTDGTQRDGLVSAPATVTLTVYGDDVNTAPVWCGVLDCTREWPKLQVQPGGSASVEVLRGWVDPEGDPLYVASALNLSEVGAVASTPDGTVLFQVPDASASGGNVEVTVRVADIRGAVVDKALAVEITATPSLGVEAFAVQATAGEQLRIDPAKHITGVAGSYRVQSAKTDLDDGSTITVDNGAMTFGFVAPTVGNYLVSFTVQDDSTEVIGTVRVTVLEADALGLSTSPITVFVKPKADATIDVFPAVSNPANRVLLLSEALPTPLGGSSLDVEVVNQQLLRVKGSTANGQPGVLGVVKYRVSDGTGNALATAHGQATVILLPIVAAQAPIAVADAVTIRAGSQLDIPVLVNDFAPDGNTLLLNPDDVIYEYDEGLAFASGSVVRYLAPETPGIYELLYTVYSAGSPEVSSQAVVRITVLPTGENRAPEPRGLTGRVLAGSTVSIPFDSFGVDPDGDTVALDRIISQPQSGSATIAPTGDAIVYTSVPGFAGPVEFEYGVSDSFGESGTAAVRVGVIDEESDPSPITYSDYVEVQLGKDNHVTVQPAANDIDPAGKKLEVTDVVPDAVAGTQEYDDLKQLIGITEDGIVTLTAGEVLGTRSFFYTVTNSTGDSNAGLIVMKVVRESVPDRPRVSDSYLTIEDRSSFDSGVDVVSGKVTWNSGNIDDLRLSLWDKNSDYRVSGWKILGSLPDESAVVPFKLTGTNVLGDEVSTYGFLRIPGKNDVILALRSGTPPQEVKEGESTTFDMADLVSVPTGESLVLDDDGLRTAGKRTDAKCTISGDTTITYSAGDGEPWVDYCAIPAKLAGQSDYTILNVAIEVIPEIPLPILHSAAITHSPAAPPTTYDLEKMVEWAGKEDSESLEYTISYPGDQFSVVQNGAELTIYALDNANPGRENTVRVSLASHPDVASAALSLKVGPAPSELPKGGTVAKECSQAGNTTSCLIKVIGVPGEVNVYRTPLVLASVTSPASCTGVTMEVADAANVRASWSGDAPGGKCTGTFVVRDPQGKTSPDDRNGSVLLDLQGFPKAPSSVIQTRYDDGMVRLGVTPGAASAAYPTITGFAIKQGSTVVAHCTPQGTCDEIRGLQNGNQLQFDAFAVNDVGESKASVQTTAWAYARPELGSVTRTLDYHPTRTTVTKGVVAIEITGSDDSVESYQITGKSSPVMRTGATTTTDVQLDVGSRTITVTPVSEVPIPPNGTGPHAEVNSEAVVVAGLPLISSAGAVSSASDTSIAVSGAAFNDNYSTAGRHVWYIASTGSASCTVDSNGAYVEPTFNGDGNKTTTSPITGLEEWTTYNVVVCVWNEFGVAKSSSVQSVPYDVSKIPVPTGYTYTIANSAPGYFLVANVGSATPVASPYHVKYTNYSTGGGATLWGQDPEIYAQSCRTAFFGEVCGAPVKVTFTATDTPNIEQVKTDTPTVSCSDAADTTISVGATGSPTPSVAVVSFEYFDGTDWQPSSSTIPVTDSIIRNVSVTISWPGTAYTYNWNSGAAEIECQ